MKHKAYVLSLTLLLGAGLSCDQNPVGLPTTGSISIVLLSPSNGAPMVISARNDEAADAALVGGGAPQANLTLDGVRVTVTGPTNKTITVTAATGGFFNVTIDGLAAGTYSVTVEGLVGGQVGHFGQTGGVNVIAGSSTPASVTFPSFQPVIPNAAVVDTSDVLRFTVSYGAVPGATGYIVYWGTSPTLAGASSQTVTGTSTEIVVTAEAKYYVAVRAVNGTVTSGGLPSAPKAVFVFQGVATVTVTPAAPTIAAGATQQFTAEGRDSDNNVVSNVTWFWVSSNQAIATVNPQTGLATGVAGGQATITAVGKGMPGGTGLTVTQPAAKLSFSIQPTASVAGDPVSPAIQVEVQDAAGNRITSARNPVTIVIVTNPGSGTLSGTRTVNAVSGIATFSGLSIDKVGAGYTLGAGSTGLTPAISSTFAISPAGVSKLAFSQQPTSVTADDFVTTQVRAEDAFGNLVSVAVPVTVAIETNAGSGTLSGTTTLTTAGGVADFSDLAIDKMGTGYTLSAKSGTLTQASSNLFDLTPGAPEKLEFKTRPTDAEPFGPMSDVEVAVLDAQGNQTGAAVDVTVGLDANPKGGVLSGTLTVTSVAGVATFSDLSIDIAAQSYTIGATSSSLTSTVSDPFDVFLQFVDAGIGTFYGCGLTVNGSAYCWGNGFNQRGDGTTVGQVSTPVRVAGGHTFIALSVGPNHSCAIRSGDRFILCWGSGGSGQLGNGGVASVNVPTLVTGTTAFSSVATGFSHTCAIRASDRRVMCWGAASNGRLGNNSTGPDVPSPALTTDVAAYSAVSSGGSHSCGIRASDGRVLCWGFAANGRLGNGLTVPDVLVPSLTTNASAFSTISTGGAHSCGIRSSDALGFCWGTGTSGQLGNNDVTVDQPNPVLVVGSLRFATITAGGTSSSCGTTLNGEGFCWGPASLGQLGNGVDVGSFPTPQPVFGGHTFFSIRPGSNVGVCSAATDGGFCWGWNGNAQLGNGSTAQSSTPTRITGSR